MKRVAIAIVVLIVAAGVFLYYPRATSTDAASAATLAVLNGDVDAQHGGTDFAPALDGDVLASGDLVRANQSGRAVLTYFEGSTLTVEPGSLVKVTSVERTAAGGLSTSVEMFSGRIWASVEKLKAGTKFEVKTPSTTAIVRGTAFEIAVAPDGTTTVKTTEGEVLVQAQGQQQTVGAGQQDTTTPGQPPSAPTPQPPTPKLRVLSQINGLGFTLVDPNGRTCGATGTQQIRHIPGCDVAFGGAGPGSLRADAGEVVAGTYTILMTASAQLAAVTLAVSGGANLDQPDFRATFSEPAGIRQGEFVRTAFAVSLTAGKLGAGPFAPVERVTSLCGAEVRGRTFTGEPRQSFAALQSYGQQSHGAPAGLVLTAAELSAVVTDELARSAAGGGTPLPLSGLTLSISGAGLRATGQATVGPLTVPLTVDVVAGASGGKLRLQVRSIDAGILPAAAKDQALVAINKALADATASFPLVVRRVVFRENCLAMTGATP